jgi:hypothetical protein
LVRGAVQVARRVQDHARIWVGPVGDFPRPRRSMQERAERSVNIGDDSRPGRLWNTIPPTW